MVIDDLAALDREIDHLEQALRLARQGHFHGVVARIEGHIRGVFLPQLLERLAATDREERKEIAACYRRVLALL